MTAPRPFFWSLLVLLIAILGVLAFPMDEQSAAPPNSASRSVANPDSAVAAASSRDQRVEPTRLAVDRTTLHSRSLFGRVVDAIDRSPLFAATVTLQVPGSADVVANCSGEGGAFLVACPLGIAAGSQLRFECAGYERRVLPADEAIAVGGLGDLMLWPAGSLCGRVHGAQLPAPFGWDLRADLVSAPAGLAVSSGVAASSGSSRSARPDAQGDFCFEALPAGSWRVTSQLADFDRVVEIQAGKQHWLDVAAPQAGDLLVGVAVDTTGRPASGVLVATEDLRAMCRADSEGRFILVRRAGGESEGQLTLRARDVDGSGGIVRGPALNRVQWGDLSAYVVFTRRVPHQVRVMARGGGRGIEFVADAFFAVPGLDTTKPLSIRSKDGVADLVGVPTGPSLLRITPLGEVGLAATEAFVELSPEGGGVSVIELDPCSRRTGALRSSAGSPLGGWRIVACDTAEMTAQERALRHAAALPDTGRVLAVATSDEAGHFSLDLPERGDLFAVARSRDGRTEIMARIPPPPEPIRLVASAGAGIRGRILGAFADFVRRYNVGRAADVQWRLMLLSEGGGGLTVPLAGDGSFRVDDLRATTWSLHWKGPAGSWCIDRIVLQEGASMERDYDCDHLLPVEFEGVVRVDGSAATGRELHLVNKETRERVTLRSDGGFRSQLPPGSYFVRLIAGAGTPTEAWIDRAEPLVVDRQISAPVRIELSSHRAIIELLRANGEPVGELDVFLDVEVRAGRSRRYRSDAKGLITLTTAPSGEFRLLRLDESGNQVTFATCRVLHDGQKVSVVWSDAR